MLKFQPNYTTSISCFEKFFIILYVLIAELDQQYVPDSVSTRRNAKNPKTTDSEIIIISLCGKIVRIDSQNA